MKKIMFIITLAVSFISGTACAAEWVNISGTVYYGSQPLNAMVLANGQHMFTDPSDGRYELEVPLNEDGEITLFGFCDGFAPFRQTLKPQEAEKFEIIMAPAPTDSINMSIKHRLGLTDSGRIKISGTVLYDETPLCAMLLANGQHIFSCVGEGVFELEVTPNENGKITLFGFCDGFAPFKYIVEKSELDADEDGDGYSVRGRDCNDSDTAIHPDAAEICGDGTDQNCDGSDSDCGDPDFTLHGGVFDGSEIHNDTSSSVRVIGAKVTLLPVIADHETSVTARLPVTGLRVYSNSFGSYDFSALPAGEYECSLVVEAEGYEPWKTVVNIALGDKYQNVNLMPSLTCYEDDECPGDMYCSKFMGDCDGKGMCSELFRFCTANWKPVCGCNGWTYSNACSAGMTGINVAYAGTDYITPPPYSACVPGPETGTLSGHVYKGACTENCAVPYARVAVTEILPPDSKRLSGGTSAETDKNGFYNLTVLPAGEYKITVRTAGYQIREGSVSIAGGEDATQDVYLIPIIAESVLRGHVYEGSVTCGTGETCTPVPVANALVSIYYKEPDVITQIPLEKHHSASTDNEGYYEFSGLPAAEYEIDVYAKPPWYLFRQGLVKIEDGENVQDIYLMPCSVCK
ncbi:MAG: hypothetical protein GY795_43810 [Desulfobacterales bacterium]|nr:hypothetical protein [Desulfobacterales bacterium]